MEIAGWNQEVLCIDKWGKQMKELMHTTNEKCSEPRVQGILLIVRIRLLAFLIITRACVLWLEIIFRWLCPKNARYNFSPRTVSGNLVQQRTNIKSPKIGE